MRRCIHSQRETIQVSRYILDTRQQFFDAVKSDIVQVAAQPLGKEFRSVVVDAPEEFMVKQIQAWALELVDTMEKAAVANAIMKMIEMRQQRFYSGLIDDATLSLGCFMGTDDQHLRGCSHHLQKTVVLAVCEAILKQKDAKTIVQNGRYICNGMPSDQVFRFAGKQMASLEPSFGGFCPQAMLDLK